MKAVVYRGPYKMSVEEVEKPRIQAPTDAIVKITSACICGSDLHMYDGRTAVKEGTIIGHEPMGVVEQAGEALQEIKVGDRVVLPFNIACGSCYNCVRGFTNACLYANPENAGAAYGYSGMGPYAGGQAEYLRVPFADFNCLKLPGDAPDELEDDFVLLADILPTAYHATELAKVEIGKTVAIYGAGPVGLLAAMSCQIKGATEIYVVDDKPDRLQLAEMMGATPINFAEGDPVEQIKDRRKHNKRVQESLRPGEDKLGGVMCGIDAVGYQCHDETHRDQERANQIVDDMARLINPTGAYGVIGVFMPQDPGGGNPDASKGVFPLPYGQLWEKGISIGTGQAPVKKYNTQLRDLIMAGKAKPSVIVSHHLPLEAAPDAYAHFDKRDEGWTKVVLRPQMQA